MAAEEALKTKAEFNNHGCAFGKVTRERVDDLREDVQWIRGRMDALLILVLTQLLVFAVAAFWFVAQRAVP